MLTARSPVTSALWLVLNLFCIAGLYITLGAQFLGVIQVLVYAGAIMVLFLFVIMLLNLGALPDLEAFNWKSALAFVLGMGILAQLLYVVARSFDALPQPLSLEEATYAGSVNQIAQQLFTKYALGLEVVGILLLAATVGAVMLAQRRFE